MTTNPLYAPLSQAVDGLEVSRRHPVVRTPAAGDFFEGALLGNGEFGAVVVPRPDAIVIHLGHNAVWDKRAQVVDPDRLGTFTDVLTAAEAAARHGRPDEDEEFARYLADTEEGYGAPYPKPFPCGSVLLSLDTRRCEVLGYHVDIATGICSVRLTVDGAPSTVATLASTRVRLAVIRGFLVATTMPLIMLLIPYYSAFNMLDLLSSPWSLGMLYVALCLPTCVLILHGFYLGFPHELREAAALDGLGPLRTFIRIVLPLSKGPIVAVGIVNGFFVWGETQLAIVLLQSPASRTIPVGLLDFKGQFSNNTGAIFAGLTLATIPLVIVYLAFHRFITKGIALGGVFR